MCKFFALLLLIGGFTFGQMNYSGYKDTVAVSDFNADSSGVTKAFDLSRYEDLRVAVYADDSSEAGYDSDSINFAWGIQFGNVVINTSGLRDTTWQGRYTVDTFDILTAGNLTPNYYNIDSSGYYQKTRLFIDTSNVTGWAVQDRQPFINACRRPWAPLFRFWYIGLGDNITGSFVELMFGQTRELYSNVHNQ